MNKLLVILMVILTITWFIGFFIYKAGNWTHMLLVVAVVADFNRTTKINTH
jgi:hypothetical protein